jgi:hypothetical protein
MVMFKVVKNLIVMFVYLLSGCSSIPTVPKEEWSKYALVRHAEDRSYLESIDNIEIYSKSPFNTGPVNVLPGTHPMEIKTCSSQGTVAKCSWNYSKCYTEAGRQYLATSSGCIDKGRRMDFPDAEKYWADKDTQSKKLAEEERAAAYIFKETHEESEYQINKRSLINADRDELERIIKSVKFKMQYGIHKDDPDGLLQLAKQNLEPYLLAEKKQKDIADAKRIKEEAEATRKANLETIRQGKLEAIKKDKEQKQIAVFRKSIKEGDETNCGPVLAVKAKLVQISFAVANYGTEHWIRRDEIFPSGYGCSFMNGQYQMPR